MFGTEISVESKASNLSIMHFIFPKIFRISKGRESTRIVTLCTQFLTRQLSATNTQIPFCLCFHAGIPFRHFWENFYVFPNSEKIQSRNWENGCGVEKDDFFCFDKQE
jgi:hypothetical protein